MHAKEKWFLFSASRCRTDAAFCHPCDLWAIHLVTYCRSPTMIYGLAISADRLADCRNCDVHEDTVGDGAHAHATTITVWTFCKRAGGYCYSGPIRERSIVMSVYVCVSACACVLLSAIISSELHVDLRQFFVCMLPIVVAQSSSGCVVIC